jgi:hypothetical protein
MRWKAYRRRILRVCWPCYGNRRIDGAGVGVKEREREVPRSVVLLGTTLASRHWILQLASKSSVSGKMAFRPLQDPQVLNAPFHASPSPDPGECPEIHIGSGKGGAVALRLTPHRYGLSAMTAREELEVQDRSKSISYSFLAEPLGHRPEVSRYAETMAQDLTSLEEQSHTELPHYTSR